MEQNPNKAALIFLICSASATHSIRFKFDGTGFESCTFNLYEGSWSRTQKDLDILNDVIIGNQHEHRVWTTGFLAYSPKIIRDEICSVVIVSSPPTLYVHDLFLYRLNPGNLFIHIIEISVLEGYMGARQFSQSISYLTLPLVLVMYDGEGKVSRQVVMIPGFPSKQRYIASKNLSLQALRLVILDMESQFDKGKLKVLMSDLHDYKEELYRRCRYAYDIQTSLSTVQCEKAVMVGETLRLKLNLTAAYIGMRKSNLMGGSQWQQIFSCGGEPGCMGSILTGIRGGGRFLARRNHGMFQVVVVNTDDLFAIYCMNTNARESFQLEFRISPYDYYAWAFIALVYFFVFPLTPHLIARLKNRGVNSSETICTLILVFAFCNLLIRWHYECVISSELTVLPPVLKINTFKELIERDYKILTYPGENFGRFQGIFSRSGVRDKLNSSFPLSARVTFYHSFRATCHLLSQCNVTNIVTVGIGEEHLAFTNKHFSSVYCYFLNEPLFSYPALFIVSGPAKHQLTHFTKALTESGFMSKYQLTLEYVVLLQQIRDKTYKFPEENKAWPFSITDWKVSSVFYGFGMLIIASLLLLLTENLKNFFIMLKHTEHASAQPDKLSITSAP